MKSFSIGKFKIGKHLENNDYYRFEILTDTVEIFFELRGDDINKEMAKEFNTKELNKEWVENFYGSDWTVDTMKLTKFETEIIEELTTFLPRHMEVYDWNLPYAEMIILIIRNLLKDKKIINTLK